MANQGLMVQVNIRKVFFPMEVLFSDGFKQLFVTVLLLIFLVFYPTPVSITWIALPLLMFIQFVIIAGCAILCSALVPFVPDLRFVIGTGLQLLFFASGVFFNIETTVLPKHRFIMYLNPIAGLIENYRQILMYANWPDWSYLAWVLAAGLSLLAFALYIIYRLDHVYPRICQQ
jgi:lipopolysaccharide transport system permease protein